MLVYQIPQGLHPQHTLPLVLPEHPVQPFMGEFQEDDLPAKQPTKQILWQIWVFFFFVYFLCRLMLCLPPADRNMCRGVSDWWCCTFSHAGSATPMLPACWELLKKEEVTQSGCQWLEKLSMVWPFSSPALYVPFTATVWFSWLFTTFCLQGVILSLARMIGLLWATILSVVFFFFFLPRMQPSLLIWSVFWHHRDVCELETDVFIEVDHFWQFDLLKLYSHSVPMWNCRGDNNRGVILPLWVHWTSWLANLRAAH